MPSLVIFDSVFGNTEQISHAVATGLGTEAQCLRAGAVSLDQLSQADLIIMGSPTRGFAATPALMSLLKSLPKNWLAGKRVAAFDTRMQLDSIKGKLFKKIVDLGGYAAPIIATQLASKGGKLCVPAAGFFVQGEEGPLVNGELERAEAWARQLQ